ncbi:MAG: RNA polymerase sigma factor [Saprospiraceae bacterium]
MNEYAFQVSDYQIYTAIKIGDENIWPVVYALHRETIIRLVIFNHGSRTEGENIFREALFVLAEKINHPEFSFKAKIQTYLIAISRNLWMKVLLGRGLKLEKAKYFEVPLDFYSSENFFITSNDRIEKILTAIEKLSAASRELLFASYYHHLSPELIREKMGYPSEDIVVAQKNSSISALKSLVYSSQ